MVQPFIKMQSIKKGEYNSYTLEGFIELLEFYKSRGTIFYIDEWAIEIGRNPSKQKVITNKVK